MSLAFKNAIFIELYKNENLLQNSTKKFSEFNFNHHYGKGYVPTCFRNEITDKLRGIFQSKIKASVKYQTPNFIKMYIFYKTLIKINYTPIILEI